MEHKQYQPTEKQLEKWNALTPATMPTDAEFKASWAKRHNGKESGWGMGKRDWVAQHTDDNLTQTPEYNLGLWQGRLDAFLGLESADTSNYHTDPYQYGYYHGHDGFTSFWKGYDRQARADFEAKYREEK